MQPSKTPEILPFEMIWMELEGIMLSEISQSEKDNFHMISLIQRISEFENKTEDHRGREGKMKQDKTKRETHHKRLLISGNLRFPLRKQTKGRWRRGG